MARTLVSINVGCRSPGRERAERLLRRILRHAPRAAYLRRDRHSLRIVIPKPVKMRVKPRKVTLRDEA